MNGRLSTNGVPTRVRLFPTPQLVLNRLPDEGSHAVLADEGRDSAPLLSGQPDLRFLHVQRRAAHPSGSIRPLIIRQITQLFRPRLLTVSGDGYITGDG